MDEFSEFLNQQRQGALDEISSPDEAVRADALLKLASISQGADGVAYAGAALDLNRKLNRTTEVLASISALAYALAESEEHEASRELLFEGLGMAQEQGHLDEVGHFHNRLGASYSREYRAQPALEQFEKALQFALESGSLRRIGYCHENLGRCLSWLGEWPKAISSYRQSASFFEADGFTERTILAYLKIAMAEAMIGNHSASIEALEIAKDYCNFDDEVVGEEQVKYAEVTTLRMAGLYQQALPLLDELTEYVKENSVSDQMEYDIKIEVAFVRLGLGMIEQAKRDFRSLARIASTRSTIVGGFEIHDAHILLLKEHGSPDELELALCLAIDASERSGAYGKLSLYELELALLFVHQASKDHRIELLEGLNRNLWIPGSEGWAKLTVELASAHQAVGLFAEAAELAREIVETCEPVDLGPVITAAQELVVRAESSLA